MIDRSASPDTALVCGFWGQNVGNAFFNLGGLHSLESVLGVGNVALIHDQQGYRTFQDQSRGNPAGSFNIIQRLDVKRVVAQGPLLTRNAWALWGPTLTSLHRCGIDLVLLGVGLFKYDRAEIAAARRFLVLARPRVVVTRDSRTYAAIHDVVHTVYDGIDSGFFVPRAYSPPVLRDSHISVGFDRRPEPRITVDTAGAAAPQGSAFAWRGSRWDIDFPAIASGLARLGKWQAYLGDLINRHPGPDRLMGFPVVRPEHRYTPHVAHKIYRRPNGFVSDEPWSYLALYANAALTLSDRVHACVAAVAYGGEAMCFSLSQRGSLLDRIGLSGIFRRPTALSRDRLETEQALQLDFLERSLG